MDTVLATILTSYTAQLDEYERALTVITFTAIGVLCTIITLTLNSPKIILCTSLVIPCLEAVYAFVFAHYTRWIAFYRGYCVHLEEKLNRETNTEDFYFHTMILKSGMKRLKANTTLLKLCFWVLYVVSILVFLVGIIVTGRFPFVIAGLFVFPSQGDLYPFVIWHVGW